MATVDQPDAPEPSRQETDAVEYYRTRGVILPGAQAEIAAYLARGERQ